MRRSNGKWRNRESWTEEGAGVWADTTPGARTGGLAQQKQQQEQENAEAQTDLCRYVCRCISPILPHCGIRNSICLYRASVPSKFLPSVRMPIGRCCTVSLMRLSTLLYYITVILLYATIDLFRVLCKISRAVRSYSTLSASLTLISVNQPSLCNN